MRLVIARGEAKTEAEVPPEPCPRTLCVHNLLNDFPKATGELCVLRLATHKRSTHEIGARIGMSHTAVVKMEAEALADAREEPRFRALMDEIGDDRAAATSIETRIRRVLAELGPSTWPMVARELGIGGDDGVHRIGARSDGDVYRAHVRQVIYRMARQRVVRLTEANGEDWFSVEDGE